VPALLAGWLLCWEGGGALAGAGWAAAPRISSARVLPGLRQGSCHGIVVFGACLLMAKLLYWLFDSAGLIHKRAGRLPHPLSQA